MWVPEYSRDYARAQGRELTYEDVEPIARGQILTEQQVAENAGKLLVQDTDLLSTIVYSHHYYGQCPEWIESALRVHLPDLYLLLYPDVPWIPDGIRDRSHLRQQMHSLFERALQEFGASYVNIRGTWDERERAAIQATSEVAQASH